MGNVAILNTLNTNLNTSKTTSKGGNSIKEVNGFKGILEKLKSGESDLSSLMELLSSLFSGKISMSEFNQKISSDDGLKQAIQMLVDYQSKNEINKDILNTKEDKVTPMLTKIINKLDPKANVSSPEDVIKFIDEFSAKNMDSKTDSTTLIKEITLALKAENIQNTDSKNIDINNLTTEKRGVNPKIAEIINKGNIDNSTINKDSNKDSNKNDNKNNSNSPILDDITLIGEKENSTILKTDKSTKFLDSLITDNDSNPKEDFTKVVMISKNATNNLNLGDSSSVNVSEKLNNIRNAVVNADNFSADIIKTVKYMESAKLKDLTVRVEPKDLGEIVIKVSMENGTMKANISASRSETSNIISANLQDMNNKLSNSDLKIGSFTMTVFTGNQGKNGEQNNNQNEKRRSKRGFSFDGIDEISDVNEETNNALSESNVNILV